MTCLFVQQLSVVDCAYLDATRGLVGESWIVDVELQGDLDEQSMILDFGDVKRRLKRALDQSLDHTLVVPAGAPGLHLAHEGESIALRFRSARGTLQHRSPRAAVSLIDAPEISCAALEAHLHRQLHSLIPANVREWRLSLRPEGIDGPYYHYVHGLKKHLGQCQRIAHGHRSRIEVRVDGARDAALEQQVSERWADIYIGSREDCTAALDGMLHFAYRAAEGAFTLSLPEDCCELIDCDSTVERIAGLLAERLAPLRRGQSLEVTAYEGVMKGARARMSAA